MREIAENTPHPEGESKDGWTPGPWRMETVRTSCGVCHKVGPWPHKWRAGETMSACIYDDYPSPPEGTDTMLANARLIAAAPDLVAHHSANEGDLVLLRMAVVAGDPKRELLIRIDDMMARTRAALARAQGDRT